MCTESPFLSVAPTLAAKLADSNFPSRSTNMRNRGSAVLLWLGIRNVSATASNARPTSHLLDTCTATLSLPVCAQRYTLSKSGTRGPRACWRKSAISSGFSARAGRLATNLRSFSSAPELAGLGLGASRASTCCCRSLWSGKSDAAVALYVLCACASAATAHSCSSGRRCCWQKVCLQCSQRKGRKSNWRHQAQLEPMSKTPSMVCADKCTALAGGISSCTAMYDLNVPWPASPLPAQVTNVRNTVAMLHALGVTHVALNVYVGEHDRVKDANPIPMAEMRRRLAGLDVRVFSRATVVLSDPARSQHVQRLAPHFDVVAVQPTTEKALQAVASNVDVDIISLPLAQRLPFFVKHKTVGQALGRGVRFEVCYAGLISGPAGYVSSAALGASAQLARKTYIGNVLQLIRASRSRGLVFSSGAAEPLHARNHADVIAVMETLGLKARSTREGFTTNPERALVSGRLRIKSHKQTVMAGNAVGDLAAATIINEPVELRGEKRKSPEDRPGKRQKS